MPLVIRKLSYSRSDWRLVLVRGERAEPLPNSGFTRKRDALPFLIRLQAVGDWDAYDAWTPAQYAAVHRILAEAPMPQALRALAERGLF